MNTLPLTKLEKKLFTWNEFIELEAFYESTKQSKSSLEVSGLNGSLVGFYLAFSIYSKHRKIITQAQYKNTFNLPELEDFLLIVPTEKDAQDLLSDLKTIFDDFNISADVWFLPWWGTVPYRPVPKRSVVFGERVSVLAKMLYKPNTPSFAQKPRIFITTQRTLQTPIPPPEYIKNQLSTLSINQVIDPINLA
ncbi:MAG: hypothetical protein ACRC5H_04550, partial [Treponemataceae bacterium]